VSLYLYNNEYYDENYDVDCDNIVRKLLGEKVTDITIDLLESIEATIDLSIFLVDEV